MGHWFEPSTGHICGCGGIGRRTRFRIWRLTAWGSSPFTRIRKKLAGLAQLVEHLICNQRVACSSHVAGIKRERSSVVEHHLAKVGVAGSNPVVRLRSRGGGTGRRTGLKILRKETFVPVRFRSSA